MGLIPGTFHAIDGVGGFSEEDVQRSTVELGAVVAADSAHRLKQLLVSGLEGASMQVFVGGRRVFECEARECAQVSRVALFGSAGALLVHVLGAGGVPAVEVDRYTRREVAVSQPPPWWEQAAVERLALSRELREGDYVFSTLTPFSADHCLP